MDWLAPDSAPTDERAFLIQLDESPDVIELVSVARYNRRDGVFLDILNRITGDSPAGNRYRVQVQR